MSGMTPVGNLSQSEMDWLQHMIRWGSDGYPIGKVGRVWIWREAFGVKGAPTTYKTKRAAIAACSAFEDILVEKSAGRL
jgi:hypothetical protein